MPCIAKLFSQCYPMPFSGHCSVHMYPYLQQYFLITSKVTARAPGQKTLSWHRRNLYNSTTTHPLIFLWNFRNLELGADLKIDRVLKLIYIYSTWSRNKQTKPKFWQRSKCKYWKTGTSMLFSAVWQPSSSSTYRINSALYLKVFCSSFMSFSSFRRLLHSYAFNYLIYRGLPNPDIFLTLLTT